MFAKIFALFALLAVAFAAPNPKPQVFAYTSGADYVYPSGIVPSVYSTYNGAYPYAAVPAFAAPYYVK
ncbi:unnamed protein product [Arctia plantaginis]|uniref:Neuropeptide-like 4 n=1 Tax=Arctia plantaginis TaxID=874455 RepID=A0A8S1ANH8_ARCPL|nr:unnamed protein product [Arctia plantaginis]